MTKCDDELGYDHILLSESLQASFGFEWVAYGLCALLFPSGGNVSVCLPHNRSGSIWFS